MYIQNIHVISVLSVMSVLYILVEKLGNFQMFSNVAVLKFLSSYKLVNSTECFG